MRIRKRFPVSSMASPLSDPQLNNSTLVQQTSPPLHPIQNMAVQHNPITDSRPSDPPARPLPSDQTPAMINNTLHSNKFKIKLKEEEEGEENGSNNKMRKEYNFLAIETVGETRVLPSFSSHPVEGRWSDGDEKIPLKKRKGAVEKEEEAVLKMKSKTNKKCSTSGMQQNQVKAGNDESNSTPNNNTVKKMNKRGGAIMEGSRCSRVNGRGWRCCQQTLVGYSLCEHHLGKGRLRSISNVKGRKTPTAAAATIAPQNAITDNSINDSASNANTTNDNESSKKVLVSSPVVQSPRPRERKSTILLDGSCYDDDEEEEENKDEDDDDDDYNEEETKKPVVAKKKRMKAGMVKARSLSSLLNQTN